MDDGGFEIQVSIPQSAIQNPQFDYPPISLSPFLPIYFLAHAQNPSKNSRNPLTPLSRSNLRGLNFIDFLSQSGKLILKVNPPTPRPKGLGLLRVAPERRFLSPP